jgi:putative hydrolase of the HAD superfamily
VTIPKPQCVIFDYGGVISFPQKQSFFEEVSSIVGAPPEGLRKAYRDCRHDYDRGSSGGAEYWSSVLQEAGAKNSSTPSSELIRRDIESWTEMNQEVLDLLSRLYAAGVFLGLLSNLPQDHLSYFVRHFDWLEYFSTRVYSCETGYAKPQPQIYSICLDRLAVPAENCLFIDDTERNVAVARKLNIKSVRFDGVDSLEREIREHLPGQDF